MNVNELRPSGIAVDPTSTIFPQNREQELQKLLADIAAHTVVSSVGEPQNASLIPDKGLTTHRYAYTTVALQQLCQLLAPGLGQLIFDLSGRYRRNEQPRSEFSLKSAVSAFNHLLTLRIARVRDRQFVRNTKDRTIDGVVGSKYRYLSNAGFYGHVKTAVGKDTQFYEGLLYGRYLVLRYILPDAIFVIDNGFKREKYAQGYHFVNSEIGEGSARVAPLLVRLSTGDTCIGPFTGRVRHQGRDFEEKLGKLMASLDTTKNWETIASQLVTLVDTKLGFDNEPYEAVIRRIEGRLVKRDVPVTQAKRIARLATITGAGDDPGVADLISKQLLVLSRRSAYDVFATIMREARSLSVNAREELEQTAHALLMNRFDFSVRE